jgi:hypothetical protein
MKNIQRSDELATVVASLLSGGSWVLAFFIAGGTSVWLGVIPQSLLNLSTLILMFILHGPASAVFNSFSLLFMMAAGALSTAFKRPRRKFLQEEEEE